MIIRASALFMMFIDFIITNMRLFFYVFFTFGRHKETVSDSLTSGLFMDDTGYKERYIGRVMCRISGGITMKPAAFKGNSFFMAAFLLSGDRI